MLGRKSGFQGCVKAVSPSVISVHGSINWFALAAKLLPPNVKTSLNLVVKMVNYIKTSALNSRFFKVVCEDIGSKYLSLLFHTDVRSLSQGNTAMRLLVLRKELLQCFRTKDHKYQKNREDENFILYFCTTLSCVYHLTERQHVLVELSSKLRLSRTAHILCCQLVMDNYSGYLFHPHNQVNRYSRSLQLRNSDQLDSMLPTGLPLKLRCFRVPLSLFKL